MKEVVPVSVIIPARNAASTLARAIESVLAQTCRPEEIIVVNDASADCTAELTASYPGVKLISRSAPGGAGAARNTGLRAALGDWIAFLDADDVWLPEKLEKQWARIASEPGASLVFCASEELLQDGKSLGDTFRGRPVVSGPDAWKALLKSNFVTTPTVMASRALLLHLGGFDETLEVGEDQDMWIRLGLVGPIAYVPDCLVKIYVQPKGLSAFRSTDQSDYVLPMIKRHIAALGDRLSRQEVRGILGERLNNAGRIAFAHGDFTQGAKFLWQAVVIGYRPLVSLMVIVKAPLGRFFRRVFSGMLHKQAAL